VSVAAIIVSWDNPEATTTAVASLQAQTVALDEIVVIDNHPEHPAVARSAEMAGARVIASPTNDGFAGGVARGIAETVSDWVLVLNPDVVAAPDCVSQLLAAATPTAGVIGAQVLLPDGRVNAGYNPVHLTGLAWSGRYGEPAESAPPRRAASVAGAAFLVRREAYDATGGFAQRYFLYHEDVELCLRMLLTGWDVIFQPAATVTHDYDFDRGAEKWFYLERNRAWTILTLYSERTLVLLLPLLLATEVFIAFRSLREGWWPQKRRAWQAVWAERRALRQRREDVQAMRQRSDAWLLGALTAEFDSALVDSAAAEYASRPLRFYRALVVQLSKGSEDR
jgi:GT2 family glycosyltransferase